MKKTLLLGLILCSQFSFGQSPESLKSILFLNETIGATAEDDGRILEYNNYRYVVVQHPNLKIQSDFYGFETLDYIPHNAAFSRISKSKFANAKAKIEAAGGRVFNLKDAWRLSKPLFTANYNEWAWAPDETNLVLWVQYYQGLSHFEVMQDLMARGITIQQDVAADRRFEIIFHPDHMDQLLALSYVQYIEECFAPGLPENYTSGTNYRTNFLQQAAFNGGLNYDGNGIMVAHNDVGLISSHIDFKGRFTNVNTTFRNSDHGFHTGGTIFGAGNRDPRGLGVASGADLHYNHYPRSLNGSDNLYTSINARLTSNSFSNGCNTGYSTWSQQLDKDAYDTPKLLHVFSAGNDGDTDCGYGAGRNWGNITGGHKQAKNVITVGAVNLTDGLASFSSRGPATDGRIKPDVVGVGVSVYSTTDYNGPNSYDSKSGTSMSCPGVTGAIAVLMQAYKELNNGAEAPGVLLKGVLMNTSEDLGNPGPDFKFGYGRINARQAYQVLENNGFQSDSLSTGDSAVFTFTVPTNTAQARFMLIWADRQASPAAARDLVNDLDIEVNFSGSNYQPWVLNPSSNGASLNSNAVRARDSLNNIEQVTIDSPSSGTATITVRGQNVPTGGDQSFYVIAFYESKDLTITYPVQGQGVEAATSSIIRFDSPYDTNYTVEYSYGGTNWNLIRSTFNTSDRQLSWSAPDTVASNLYLRVYSVQDTATVGPLSLAPTVPEIRFLASCPDSVKLDWDNIPGASGYVVYRLGAKYMDSIAYVDSSEARIAHFPFDDDWYAVAAVINQTGVGFRSLAFQKRSGIFSCVKPIDLKLDAVLAPGNAEIPSCIISAQSAKPKLLIRNVGTSAFSNFDVKFEATGSGNTISETVNRTLNPGDTLIYTFQNNSVTLQRNNINRYTFWIESNDQNRYNDSLIIAVQEVDNSSLETVPYLQDFENFSNCTTGPDCEMGACTLIEGWYNYQNQLTDFIDFRTHNGFTNNAGTGPSFDATTGTSQGKYIYLDASGDCDSAEAMVLSPCIDLSNTTQPHATVYYHMLGGEMGRLAVDVYDGNRWYLNQAPVVSGNQGNGWKPLSIDLSAFVGKTINVRYRAKTGDGNRSDLGLDDFSVIDSSAIGIPEIDWANGLHLYPNPNKGRFTLSSDLPLDENTEIEISDLSGALIWQGLFKANADESMIIDFGEQANGVYILTISNEGYRSAIRMIKE